MAQATKKKNQPASVLDQPWRYSYVTRPLSWAVSVWLLAYGLHALELRQLWVALGCVGLVLLSPLVPIAGDGPRRTVWFAFVLAVYVAGWVCWIELGDRPGPMHLNAVLALVPGTAVLGVWWHWIVRLHDYAADAAEVAADKALRDAARGDIPAVLANCGFRGIKGGPVERFEAGRMQKLTLPANGSVTFRTLHAATEKVSIAMRAKYPIRFIPGDHAAEVIVLVLEEDVLAQDQPYPLDRGPKSINKPMSLGRDETGTVQVVTFRELSALVVGERGTGKSAFLNSNLAYLTGCVDALVWMIDFKGGRTARPWLQPFLDGIGKPALDWCAIASDDDTREADWMIMAARAVIAHRSRTGKGEKVHPTPAQPAIILIVEEASLVTGVGNNANAKRAELMKQNIVLGRSEAVDGFLVGQRNTVTMIGQGDMKSQLQYIVGLGISKMEEAVRLFGDAAMAREALSYASNDDYKGVMLVKAPGFRSVLPIKGWWLDTILIPGLAQTNAEHRPDLEEDAVDYVERVLAAAGCPGGYVGRWDRFRDALDGVPAGGAETATGVSQRLSPNPDGRTTAERLGFTWDTGGAVSGTPGAGVSETPAAPVPGTPGGPSQPPSQDDAFTRLMAAEWDSEAGTWRDTEDPADLPYEERVDDEVIPPILRHLVQIFAARQADQLLTETILSDLPGEMTHQRFGRLMGHCGVAPLKEPFVSGDKRGRGYSRLDIARAFTRARDQGDMPPQAFDWRP